jgi:type IV pilus biogenesis protein CpaD/CtpE
VQEARIEIRGAMTRHAAEALSLEIRRLARQYGIDVTQVRVERPEEERLP